MNDVDALIKTLDTLMYAHDVSELQFYFDGSDGDPTIDAPGLSSDNETAYESALALIEATHPGWHEDAGGWGRLTITRDIGVVLVMNLRVVSVDTTTSVIRHRPDDQDENDDATWLASIKKRLGDAT